MIERGKYIRVNKGLVPNNNRIGMKFNKLTVISQIGFLDKDKCKEKKIYWLCECDCGKTVEIPTQRIGKQKSCGCIRLLGSHRTHNDSKSIEYRTWCSIKARCNRKNHCKYESYGGRGIKVFKEWEDDYTKFLDYIGRRPENMNSIDRINVDGNYEPGNVRWANDELQTNNKRQSVIIEYKGFKLSIKQWAVKIGCDYSKLYRMIRRDGATMDDVYKRFCL